MTTASSSPASQPAHTNRLIDATSPYLLQHAHNPVDWYPWGSEALEKARKLDKPIFLSIGYAACHWCHVMERESFENPAIAAILNQHFVAIKVDREERPDLDDVYMNATIVYNQGQGGWPMSVFLTPEQKPFFAGTYFPPEPRWGRPGFGELLETIAKLWRDDRQRLLQAADGLSDAVRQISDVNASDDGIPLQLVTQTAHQLAGAFDPRTGGLPSGGTNKFPPSMAMSLMLRVYDRSARAGRPPSELLQPVELTLDHMARGGIYDHLAGGIARYSTDTQWLVPHFEKMLYDQALVSSIYLEAHQLTGKKEYAQVARGILDYVLADLQSPEGGFYSTRDADSEGVEGKYYVWSREEIMRICGPREGEWFCSYYDVTDAGNWEGHNILNVQRSLDTVARLHGISVPELSQSLEDSRIKLLAERAKRVPPGLDDKVLTSWNGLMIASLARAAYIVEQPVYAQAAARAADFVLHRLTSQRRLLRTYRQGKAHTGGYLDDYAFFVEGLLELYEATFDVRWLDEAIRLTEDMISHFWDEQAGGFFFTANDAEQLILRSKDSRDSAVPSGNSVALMNLLRLGQLLDRADLREKAEQTMRAFAGSVAQTPTGFDRFLAAVDFHHGPKREVVVAGALNLPSTQALLRAVREVYDPYRVVVQFDPASPGAEGLSKRIPLLEGKTLVNNRPAVYVCRDYTCQRPITEASDLRKHLR